MSMKPKTAAIDGKLVEIISEDEFRKNSMLYQDSNSMMQQTAVEVELDGNKYALPLRGRSDDSPGIIPQGPIYFINLPDNQKDSYNENNLDIVDYENTENVADFLKKNEQVRKIENTILTDIDNVFCPSISEGDSPEIKLFKTAIASKKCDLNKYAPRFGDNYLNDKRILKGKSITINKLVSMSEKLDIMVKLTLSNANDGNVPNPMPQELSIVLTGEEDCNDE